MAERSLASQKLDALEKALGKGETFDLRTRTLILKNGVPAWLLVAIRVLPAGPVRGQCEAMVETLRALHGSVEASLPEVLRANGAKDG